MRLFEMFKDHRYVIYWLVHLILFMLGAYFLRSSDITYQSIGASLMAAGIAGAVIFIYIMYSQNLSDKLEIISRFGITNIFEARAARIKSIYDEKLNTARNNIDILGFGLSALREDYLNDFVTWKTRAKVRILLIDPEFPTSEFSLSGLRDREEGDQAGEIEREVRQFIEDTRDIVDDDFQIRLYRCLPSVNIFRVDDDLFWGPYLMREQSRNTPTMLVRGGGLLFEKLQSHFEVIWEDSNLSRSV